MCFAWEIKMEDEIIKEDIKWAKRKTSNSMKELSGSSWSGSDRTLVELMIYRQLKRIADILDSKKSMKGT